MYLKEEEINGYVLTERLRKARRRHHLSAPCQALYYELVAICNEESWEDVFKCSNDELTRALNVTEKSLINYRLELIQAGLIGYRSGKTKKNISDYSFTKQINGCKIYSQSDSPNDSQSGSPNDSPKGEKASDINKGKKKTKNKLNNSSPGGEVPEKKVTEHWEKLVECWFVFYEEKFKAKPIFNAANGEHLKKIASNLKKTTQKEWIESYAIHCLTRFLQAAWLHSDWLKNNFELKNLLSNFNSITNSKNGTGNTIHRANHSNSNIEEQGDRVANNITEVLSSVIGQDGSERKSDITLEV